jgi:hypothetical protein
MLHVIDADPITAVLDLESSQAWGVGYLNGPVEYLARVRVHTRPMPYGAGTKLNPPRDGGCGLAVHHDVRRSGRAVARRLGSFLVNDQADEIARRAPALYRDRERWNRDQGSLLHPLSKKVGPASFWPPLSARASMLGSGEK